MFCFAPGDLVIVALWLVGVWLVGRARQGLSWHDAHGTAPDGQTPAMGMAEQMVEAAEVAFGRSAGDTASRCSALSRRGVLATIRSARSVRTLAPTGEWRRDRESITMCLLLASLSRRRDSLRDCISALDCTGAHRSTASARFAAAHAFG
jgi:hypothetical protein